ncbi:MAG: hypothetical protein H6947_11210 [Zoogloeaceae bacterium]|nr:hypothetical protein [Zoogloeaceae bacterium]MCP5255006.1 hypothetical protein [Zoogloeaceae bacterium]
MRERAHSAAGRGGARRQQGCVVAIVVGTAVAVGIEVVKVPFKVAGAAYDLASDSDSDSDDEAEASSD